VNSRSRKQRIRARMERTGETYTQAMKSMDDERAARATVVAVEPKSVDESMRRLAVEKMR
jgi:hypothetical protein